MSRFVCLLGSPRANGSSDTLANRFCAVAENAGANVATHALRDLRFQGHTPPTDGLYEPAEDDLDLVLSDIQRADVLVLATPIYFCDMTGLMKQALDRFDAFLVRDPKTGRLSSKLEGHKTLVVLQVQANDDTHHKDLMAHYRLAFDSLGFIRQECLRAHGVNDPRDLKAAQHWLVAVERLAKDVLRREYA